MLFTFIPSFPLFDFFLFHFIEHEQKVTGKQFYNFAMPTLFISMRH